MIPWATCTISPYSYLFYFICSLYGTFHTILQVLLAFLSAISKPHLVPVQQPVCGHIGHLIEMNLQSSPSLRLSAWTEVPPFVILGTLNSRKSNAIADWFC